MRHTAGLNRRLKWQDRQGRLLSESNAELAGAEADLSIVLCLRDFVEAASSGPLEAQDILAALLACSSRMDAALRKQPLSDAEVSAWVLGDIRGGQTSDLVERVREIVMEAANRTKGSRQTLSHLTAALEWLAEWVLTADQQVLKWLFAKSTGVMEPPTDGADPLDAITSGQQIALLRSRAEALRKERQRLRAGLDDVRRRTTGMTEHIAEPIDPVLDGDIATPGLLLLLCWALKVDAALELWPNPDMPNERENMLLGTHIDVLEWGATDPHFWFAGLWNVLRDAGATLGFGLRPWAVDLLRECVGHPGRLRRMPVPDQGFRARSILGKHIAPILSGHHPNNGIAEEMDSIKAGGSIDVLAMFCLHIASAMQMRDGRPVFRNARHRQAAAWLWSTVLGPYRTRVTSWICEGAELAGELVVVEEPDDTTNVLPDEPGIATDGEHLDVLPETTTWFYVPNPGSTVLKMEPVEIPSDDGGSVLGQFLRHNNVPLVVKPASIVGALDFYSSMPDLVQAQTPYDDLGPQRWHKLKRGAQRIYVRIEEDGRLLFHPYRRKDWKADWINHAA